MAEADYLKVSTGTLITSSIHALTISSGTTYARTLSTTNLYANNLYGDGSHLSNVPFTPNAYSIPWNAMQSYGGLIIESGDWYLQNVTTSSLAVSSFFTASSINTKGITAIHGNIASLTSRVISTFLISSDTLTVDTNYFNTQRGNYQIIASSFMKYLSAETLAVGNTNIDVITGSLGRFSSLSTGVWNAGDIIVSSISLYDKPISTKQTFIMSASHLLVNGSDFLGSTVQTSNLTSTTQDILFNIYKTSNAIDIRENYSTLLSNTYLMFSTTQFAVSSLSTAIGFNSNFTVTSMSNLSVSIDTNFASMCNYTINSISSLSTSVSLTANSNLSTLSNYTSTSLCTLTVGLSTSIINLSNYTNLTISNLSTSVGSNISTNVSTLSAGISSVGFLMASGISTSWLLLSTATAYNFSNTQYAISTSISNLSVTTQSNFFYYSTISGSNTSTLNTQLTSTISSFSTLIGITMVGLSTFSTITGSNFSTVNMEILSTFSTLSTSIGLLTVFTTSNFSVVTANLLSTISTFSTAISQNSIGLSTFSTITGSNLSTQNNNLLSTISTFSTVINTNFIVLQSGFSTFSTVSASNYSTLSTIIQNNFSTLSTIIQFNFSTLSTSIGSLSNISLSSFSTLSTTIGTTSNFLHYFSTISTILQSSFSSCFYVIESGLSSLSTAITASSGGFGIQFNTLLLCASTISSGNLSAKFMYASTLSTNSLFFRSMTGSTMSSLTQNVGVLNTSQAITSSFSGNYADAHTMTVQNL